MNDLVIRFAKVQIKKEIFEIPVSGNPDYYGDNKQHTPKLLIKDIMHH